MSIVNLITPGLVYPQRWCSRCRRPPSRLSRKFTDFHSSPKHDLDTSIQPQIKANVFWTVFRSLRIVGSYVGNRADAIQALDFASRDKVVTTLAQTLPIDKLPEVYEDMAAGKVAGRIVLNL